MLRNKFRRVAWLRLSPHVGLLAKDRHPAGCGWTRRFPVAASPLESRSLHERRSRLRGIRREWVKDGTVNQTRQYYCNISGRYKCHRLGAGHRRPEGGRDEVVNTNALRCFEQQTSLC